jgi:hypothetical protein
MYQAQPPQAVPAAAASGPMSAQASYGGPYSYNQTQAAVAYPTGQVQAVPVVGSPTVTAQPVASQPSYTVPQVASQSYANPTYSYQSSLSGQPVAHGGVGSQVAAGATPGYQIPTGAPVQVALGGRCAAGGCNTCQPGGCAMGGCQTGGCQTGGCQTGSCQTGSYGASYGAMDSSYGCGGYGGCGGYSTYGCGLGNGLMGGRLGNAMQGGCGGCGNYWFGGVYGLLMEVNTSSYLPTAFAGTGLAVGDYPTRSDFVLFADDADVGYQGGVEARVGRTMGDCCCGPRWGLEGVYWQIFDDSATATYTDVLGSRTYSMMDFRGLRYDPGAGFRPANDYVDYAPPVADYTGGGAFDQIDVQVARVRRSFEVKNAEVNLLRLSLCGGGYGGGIGMGSSCGGCAAGGCATGGCAAGGCASNNYLVRGQGCCGSRFSCTGVCGFRYLEIDESFMTGYDYLNTVTLATGFLNRTYDIENRLAGFQTGCNGLYRLGCKWGLHINTTVGVYGNDIDSRHCIAVPVGGTIETTATNESVDVRASKTDVSILGEARLGLSYQCKPNCRIYGGWRVVGISGVALATDQIPVSYTDAAALRWLDSDGSLIIHGLQTGLEWNY